MLNSTEIWKQPSNSQCLIPTAGRKMHTRTDLFSKVIYESVSEDWHLTITVCVRIHWSNLWLSFALEAPSTLLCRGFVIICGLQERIYLVK